MTDKGYAPRPQGVEGIAAAFKAIKTRLDDLAARITSLNFAPRGDEGWTDLTPASGVQMQGAIPAQAMIRSGMVMVAILVDGTGSSAVTANSTTTVLTLPARFRPDRWHYLAAGTTDAGSDGLWIIKSDGGGGDIQLRTTSTVRAYYGLLASWPAVK